MSPDLIDQLVDRLVDQTLVGGRKTGDMVVDGQTATEISQFKTLLAAKLREASAAPGEGGGVESVTAGDASLSVNNTDPLNPTVKLPYLVYAAFVEQEGGDDPQSATSGSLVVGVSYTIDTLESGDDFTNVGAPSNTEGVIFVATGTTPTNWTNGSDIRWNGGAPVAVTLQNTFPTVPTWSRFSGGSYKVALEGAFPADKTFVLISQIIQNDTALITTIYSDINYRPNEIDIYTANFQVVDGALEKGFADGLMDHQYVEIRVYP